MPVETELDLARDTDRGERVAAADRTDVHVAGGGRGEDLGELIGAARRDRLDRGHGPVGGPVTLMVDDPVQLDLVESACADAAWAGEVRVCLDLDASYRAAGGRVHLGPRRSPVHSVDEAVGLARKVLVRQRFRLVGLMAYEGQVAGLQDRPAGNPLRGRAVRAVKALSVAELAERRVAVVAAVSALTPLELVTGGGTGSIGSTVAEGVVTEVAAGSGLFAPALFDGYDGFRASPSAFFGLEVTRRPSPGIVTVTGGGWIASGPAGRDRLPVPTYPTGLRLLGAAGAGEVQTPLTGRAPGVSLSATGSGSGTPRPAICASGWTSCTWCRVTRWWRPFPPTAARGGEDVPVSRPGQEGCCSVSRSAAIHCARA